MKFISKCVLHDTLNGYKHEFEMNEWDEHDFAIILENWIQKEVPTKLIVRGLPGAGKTFLSNFIAGNIMNCISIDIDMLRSRGKVISLPRYDGLDCSVMYGLLRSIEMLGANVVVSSVFSTIKSVKSEITSGYHVFIADLIIDVETSKKYNKHNVKQNLIKRYSSEWVRWDDNKTATKNGNKEGKSTDHVNEFIPPDVDGDITNRSVQTEIHGC